MTVFEFKICYIVQLNGVFVLFVFPMKLCKAHRGLQALGVIVKAFMLTTYYIGSSNYPYFPFPDKLYTYRTLGIYTC